jgi:hypothetical protein
VILPKTSFKKLYEIRKIPVNELKGEKGNVVDPLKKKRLFGTFGVEIRLKLRELQLQDEDPY